MLTLLPILGLFVPSTPLDRVALTFDPAPGRAVRKTFEGSHVLTVESYRRTLGDQTATAPMPVRIHAQQHLEVVDEASVVRDGRPERLRRTYVGGSLEARLESLEPGAERELAKIELGSQVRGASVLFEWIADEAEYGRCYDARELPERWLPDLVADLDLLALLPPAEVAVGETWTVGPEALAAVLAPFGNPHLEAPPKNADRMLLRSLGAGVGANLQQAFGGASSGDVELELVALDGDLARVKVRVPRVSLVRDLTEYTSKAQLELEEEAGFEPSNSRLAIDLAGQGELVWNRAAGRAQSLELNLQETVTMGVRVVGEAVEVWDEIRLTGLLTQRFGSEPGEATPAPGPAVTGK